jgi:hypothetical protein
MMKKVHVIWKSASEKYPLLLFYAAVLAIAVVYYYHIILFSPPQSIHRWRQTDSASITLNLYQHGMKFFQPEVHSLSSDDFTTGYATAEAPLLYYLIALLYKIFGPHDYIYRIVNTAIFLTGLGALFRIAQNFLKDFVAAAFVPLFIFVSPVMAYYGNNFLTDSTALALVFGGWWQYIRYLNGRRYRQFIFSTVLLSVAGLLKATMTLNLLSFFGLAFIWHTGMLRKKENQLFPGIIATFLPLITGLLAIIAWYSYAIWFNGQHDSLTFLTAITPWWKITAPQRQEITRFILKNNITMYYSAGALCFLAGITVFIVYYFRRIPEYLGILTLLLFTGGFFYVNLYYSQFQYHDYYLLILFCPVAFLVLACMTIFRSVFQKVYSSRYFSLALIVFLVVNVFHARHEMTLRYFGWKREYPVFESYFTIRPYLDSLGIKPDDRVISMPDYTNCYTLYLMNRPGNTLGDIGPDTPARIKRLTEKGARYLVINDTAFLRNPVIQEFTHYKAGQYREIQIFRIDSCNIINKPDSTPQRDETLRAGN